MQADLETELKAAWPGIEILVLPPDQCQPRIGFGIEITVGDKQARIAWLVKDTPEAWANCRTRALDWLDHQRDTA